MGNKKSNEISLELENLLWLEHLTLGTGWFVMADRHGLNNELVITRLREREAKEAARAIAIRAQQEKEGAQVASLENCETFVKHMQEVATLAESYGDLFTWKQLATLSDALATILKVLICKEGKQ